MQLKAQFKRMPQRQPIISRKMDWTVCPLWNLISLDGCCSDLAHWHSQGQLFLKGLILQQRFFWGIDPEAERLERNQTAWRRVAVGGSYLGIKSQMIIFQSNIKGLSLRIIRALILCCSLCPWKDICIIMICTLGFTNWRIKHPSHTPRLLFP